MPDTEQKVLLARIFRSPELHVIIILVKNKTMSEAVNSDFLCIQCPIIYRY